MNDVQPGQQLGPYRIISQIGQGGMATVYKAYHAAMDRYVAVKVLPKEFASSPEFMSRFQQEARTIANLEHPHILPVHDFGESGGIHYFVMRFLDTGTLKERIRSGPIDLPEIDRLFTQLADALGYAHERGVIHRDIKPSNVLVNTRGDVFLTDFGIAKLMEGAAQLTATGAVTGTPAYMSPEQAQGEKIDQRSDIYSLGIVLYEMITGRVPFEAETPLAVILKQMQAPLPLPSEIKPGVSPDIERVLLKALAKDRNDRFATCKDFLSAWKHALTAPAPASAAKPSGDTVKAPPPQPTVEAASPAQPTTHLKPPPPARKSKIPTMGIIGGAALFVVCCLCAGLLVIRGQTQKRNATASAVAVGPTPAPGETAAPPTESAATPEVVVTVQREGGWASWAAGNFLSGVVAVDRDIIVYGPGSVTVWDRFADQIVERYTTGNGLPDPYVRAVLPDDHGEYWVATDGGLGRFDGNEWTLYNRADGLDSDDITALAFLRDGRLAVGTGYCGGSGCGLNVFDGSSWQSWVGFPSANADEQPDQLANFVSAIYDDPNGSLWVGTTNGLGRYDYDSAAWTRYTVDNGLPDNNILTIFVDGNGGVFVGTGAGAARFDGERFEPMVQGPPYGVYGIVTDAQGRYWFSGGGGAWRFDSAKGDWQEFSQQTGDMPTYNLYGAARDADGNIYFATEGAGVVRFDGQEFSQRIVPNLPGPPSLGKIIPAPDGSLWFVDAYGARVAAIDPLAETWTDESSDLPGPPLFFDSQGRLWVSEYDQGFSILDGSERIHIGAEHGLTPDYQIRDISLAPDGTAWIATTNGVAVFDGTTITSLLSGADFGLPSNFVRAIFAASDGSIWLSGETQLSHYLPDGTFTVYGSSNLFGYEAAIFDIAEDSDGAIWAATDGGGVYRFADGNWQHFGDELPPYVNSITVARDGTLWFGTSEGAAHFDGSTWERYSVSDGLIHSVVFDVFVDDFGGVWFATYGGASRFYP